MTSTKLTPQEVREVAAEAICDPRTVRAYLREPASVKSTSRKRIERALTLIFRDENDECSRPRREAAR